MDNSTRDFWLNKDQDMATLITWMESRETGTIPIAKIKGILSRIHQRLDRGDIPDGLLKEPSKTLQALGMIGAGASLRLLMEAEALSPGFTDQLTLAAQGEGQTQGLQIHLRKLALVQRHYRLSQAFSPENIQLVEDSIKAFQRKVMVAN